VLTQFCQEISAARGITAYIVALPAAIAAGGALFVLLGQLRTAGPIARFVARVAVFVGALFAFGLVMQLIGGPCWLAGPMHSGAYNSRPVTGRDLVTDAIAVGVVFALVVPFVAKARGLDIGS
jgi:hypothetical protein